MVEFVVRNKHPVWLTLVSNRFLLVENINLSPQDLIFAITELFNAIKEKENYLVNIISSYCKHECSSSEDRKFVPNLLPTPRSSKRKYFDRKRYPFEYWEKIEADEEELGRFHSIVEMRDLDMNNTGRMLM
eukprot:sb/3475077/